MTQSVASPPACITTAEVLAIGMADIGVGLLLQLLAALRDGECSTPARPANPNHEGDT